MRKTIPFLFAIAAMMAALVGPRESLAMSFSRGEVLQHNLSVCINKADAVEILDTEAKSGFDAALAVWNSKEKCAPVPVVGGVVGKVVHTVKVVRGGEKLTVVVVEILDQEGKVVAYFMTSAPVSSVSADKLGDPRTRFNA